MRHAFAVEVALPNRGIPKAAADSFEHRFPLNCGVSLD
jgi:hypothetical protein